MRTSGKILVGAAVLVFGALLAKNSIIKSVAVHRIEKVTGFGLELKGMDVGLLKPSFEITGLKLKNPADFPDREAFDVDRLYVRYDVMSFLTSTVRLREVVIEIPQVVMVKKPDGESNMDRMKDNATRMKTTGGAPSSPGTPEPRPDGSGGGKAETPKPARAVFIEKLAIKIGKVEMRDHGRLRDGKPKVTTFEINLDRHYSNVANLETVLFSMVTEAVIQGSLQEVSRQLEKSGKDGNLNETFQKIGQNLGNLFKKSKGGKDAPAE